MEHALTLPVRDQAPLKQVRAGDLVNLSGILYTARDQAHKRLMQALAAGDKPPFDMEGAAIYYCGPTPPRADNLFGSAGPTTSARMDEFTLPLLKMGLKITIGKGQRSDSIRAGCAEFGALYLVTFGGAGAFLAGKIISQEILAYPDLGAEAVYRLEVRDFPAIAAYDTSGNSIF